ncbi:MAG: hypothetical protein ACYCUI_13675 [Vulcanimicrobiaceae bacterium]
MNGIQRDRAYGRRLARMKPDAIAHRGDRQPSQAERMQRYVSLRAILPIESTVSPPRVQREAVRSPTHAPQLAPRLPASEQQPPLPAERKSAGDKQ